MTSRLASRVWPTAAYVLAALVYTWPIVTHLTTRLAALHGPGDPYLYVWILGWNLETLSLDPWALVNGRIFDANIFHPARQTLAYSDHMLPQSVLLWPLYVVTRDVVLCYNALFMASLVASAVAMRAFVREVVGHDLAAFAAGLVWGFWPFHVSHLAHLQLQGLYVLPLTFLFLHRLVTRGDRRDAVLLGVTAALQTLVSMYYGVIGAVGLGVGALAWYGLRATGFGGQAKGDGRLASGGAWLHVRRLSLAGLVGLVLILPVMIPYWQVQQREGFGRNLDEASRHAATLGSYVSVPPVNALYGRLGLLPHAPEEQALFPGLIVTMLAMVGVVSARRFGLAGLAVAAAAVAVTGAVLSLGPEGVRTLYATLHRTLFGFHAIRAPARFGVLVTFGLATLAAIGIRRLTTSSESAAPRWTAPLVVMLLALEYANVPIAFAPAPALRTEAGAWLRTEPTPGAVLYLPLELDALNTPFMVQSLEHRRPIVNGASGHRPGFFPALVDTMVTFPDAESLWMLRELDVRFVVSPAAVDTGDGVLVERARLDESQTERPVSHIYELTWSPEAEARLEAAALVSPPDPGPPPFAIGERAEYDVRWLGAGASLSAGAIAIGVESPGDPADGASYRFVATAETADWVSRFFEARDRFETTADDQLLPLLHERAIREGRRRLDRVVRFNHAERRLDVFQGAEGGESIAHRMPPGTRDAVTAFFYLRAMPLTPATNLQVPINEVGRNQTLVVGGVREETIDHEGRVVGALRLEPQIVQRVARRAPLQIVVWLSADARRIPLRFEVSGAFGTVQATLTSYRPGEVR